MTAHDYIAGLDLHYFSPDEILFLGQSNDWLGSNSLPPEHLWGNIRWTAWIADLARHKLGRPVWILSGYRNETYNSQINGAANSMHLRFNALDLRCNEPRKLRDILHAFRSSGLFRGGIGTYSSFVHLDTRGTNSTW